MCWVVKGLGMCVRAPQGVLPPSWKSLCALASLRVSMRTLVGVSVMAAAADLDVPWTCVRALDSRTAVLSPSSAPCLLPSPLRCSLWRYKANEESNDSLHVTQPHCSAGPCPCGPPGPGARYTPGPPRDKEGAGHGTRNEERERRTLAFSPSCPV